MSAVKQADNWGLTGLRVIVLKREICLLIILFTYSVRIKRLFVTTSLSD